MLHMYHTIWAGNLLANGSMNEVMSGRERLKQHEKMMKRIGWLLFYIYIVLLSYFLFFSEHYGRDISSELRSNLEPLKEIKRFIKYRKQLGLESFVVNILGNIFAFAPFGYLLPLLNKNYRNFLIVTLLTGIFSLTVEFIQLNFMVGIFDVDDIILNSIGGFLGYLLFILSYYFYDRYKKKRRFQSKNE